MNRHALLEAGRPIAEHPIGRLCSKGLLAYEHIVGYLPQLALEDERTVLRRLASHADEAEVGDIVAAIVAAKDRAGGPAALLEACVELGAGPVSTPLPAVRAWRDAFPALVNSIPARSGLVAYFFGVEHPGALLLDRVGHGLADWYGIGGRYSRFFHEPARLVEKVEPQLSSLARALDATQSHEAARSASELAARWYGVHMVFKAF